MKKIRINLGCGNQKFDQKDGWINIDISEAVKPDLILDITKGLPYKSDSIDEIVANGVLEQIESNKDFVFVLNECHRVLKKDGVLKGQVPSTNLSVLFLDFMDRRFFQEESFDYFNKDKHAWRNFGCQYGVLPWKDIIAKVNENGIVVFQMQPYGK